MELIDTKKLLEGYKLKDGDSVIIDSDSLSIIKYFHGLKKINLIADDNFIFEALEIAGFLRERQVEISVNNFPPSYEPKLVRHKKLEFPITRSKGKGLTWKVSGVDFLPGDFVLGKDFPVSDERTGILGYLVNKKAVVIFGKSNGDYIEGKIVGKLDGDEEYLVRPNKWLTDLVVFKATFKKGKAIVDKKLLFCRPLGSVFLPLNRRDVYNVLLKLKIRSSGYPVECYDYKDSWS